MEFKEEEIKKKKQKKVYLFLIVGLILFLGGYLFVSSEILNSEPSNKLNLDGFVLPVEESNYVIPFWMGEDQYGYDSDLQMMIDNNGITYKTETNGVMTINDERYIAFAINATTQGGTNVLRTSLDFDWVWHKKNISEIVEDTIWVLNSTQEYNNVTDTWYNLSHQITVYNEVFSNDLMFWAEANESNKFFWYQYWTFYEDPNIPMKFEMDLTNDWVNFTDVEMYYLFNLMNTDTITYDGTSHLLSESLPVYKKGNFNNVAEKINFNSDYDFIV